MHMNGSHANPLRVPTDPVPVQPKPGRVAPVAAPVRVAIPVHQRTEGKHRLRISLTRETAHRLAQGLRSPRLHVTGTVETGFRLWCTEHGGYAPIEAKYGGWSVSLSIRRVHGRERAVPTEAAPHHWDRDDTGPVLVLDPLPAHFHRERGHHKPDHRPAETAMSAAFAEAEARLKEAMAEQFDEASTGEAESAPPEPARPVLTLAFQKAEPEPVAMPDPTPARAITDLREAIGLVNELLAEAGDGVTLLVTDEGRLSAKRRVVSYIDL